MYTKKTLSENIKLAEKEAKEHAAKYEDYSAARDAFLSGYLMGILKNIMIELPDDEPKTWTPEDIVLLANGMDYQPDDDKEPVQIVLDCDQVELVAKCANENKADENQVRDMIQESYSAWVDRQKDNYPGRILPNRENVKGIDPKLMERRIQ